MTLPPNLYDRCCKIFSRCSQFSSHHALQSVFVTTELEPFKRRIPETDHLDNRVAETIAYLLDSRTTDGKNVLHTFIGELRKKYEIGDILRDELELLQSDVEQVVTQSPPPNESPPPRHEFKLRFMNRELEKQAVHRWLESDFYTYVYAPAGMGKTYLLKEIQCEKTSTGWHVVWMDFASEESSRSKADEHHFLLEFSRKALTARSADIGNSPSSDALDRVGRLLAELSKPILLVLDNADQGDKRILTWIRESFLVKLATWVPVSHIHMLASGQRTVPEWSGRGKGRPFQVIPLSSFEDRRVISEVIEYVVVEYGAKEVKKKRDNHKGAWATDLETMVDGLFEICRGHPLIMERVLEYAIAQDGLVHPSYFSEKKAILSERCLRPVVGERILPTIDRSVQEAFRVLCLFRYVWGGLVEKLSSDNVPSEFGGPWEPFHRSQKDWRFWWPSLKDSHFIEDADPNRLMHPISSTTRQVIALVLETEDHELFGARTRRACQIYEDLYSNSDVSPQQRAACFCEYLFHATQNTHSTTEELASSLTQRLDDFLRTLSTNSLYSETARNLLSLLRADRELRYNIDQVGGQQLYDQLLDAVSLFVTPVERRPQ